MNLLNTFFLSYEWFKFLLSSISIISPLEKSLLVYQFCIIQKYSSPGYELLLSIPVHLPLGYQLV
jgi:hypothetical protein